MWQPLFPAKMKKMKFSLACATALIVISGACGRQKTDETTNETAAQIEAARNAGREAARLIITREFKDSMEFHGAILEAASRKASYQMEHHSQSEAAFDSAFISTIRTVRPDLARRLE